MRPGQLTPENRSEASTLLRTSGWRFNEAGAINPGKRKERLDMRRQASCFNEAGAINPGKQSQDDVPRISGFGFNEAGAINPGKPLDSL